MLCEKCKKNKATVLYTESINGKESSYSLCRECMDRLKADGTLSSFPEFSVFSGGQIGDIFGTLFAPTVRAERSEGKTCTLCGSTFAELRASGKVGCPKCYEIFADELAPTVARIHGNSRHTGKAPAKFKGKLDAKRQIASLEKQMKDAIKRQDFERAAELRDEIKAIREEGGVA